MTYFTADLHLNHSGIIPQAKEDPTIDPGTGIRLTPSPHGEECLGNGTFPGLECCCDNCDYFLDCFPDA